MSYLDEIKTLFSKLESSKIGRDNNEELREMSQRLMRSIPFLIGQVEAYEKCLGTGILERSFAEPPINESEQRQIANIQKGLHEFDKWEFAVGDDRIRPAWNELRDSVYEFTEMYRKVYTISKEASEKLSEFIKDQKTVKVEWK